MKRFAALIAREFRLFFSNNVAVLILFGAPLAYGLFFGFVYYKGVATDLPVAVVDMNSTTTSRMLIDAIDDNQHVAVQRVVPDISMLAHEMLSGEIVAVVSIPERFEQDVLMQRSPALILDVSATNIVNANFAIKGIRTSLETINAGMQIEGLRKQGVPAELASQQFQAFSIQTMNRFNPSLNYLIFLYPGLLATILQQVMLLGLALSFSKEYEEDTFRELTRQTRSPLLILLVKSLPYLFMGWMIWMFCLHVMLYGFGVPMAGSWSVLYGISALFILAVTALGILVSAVIPNQLKATEVLMVIATPAFIISGFTWPLSQMPDWVGWAASVIPLTHFLEALRNIMLAGAGWEHILPEARVLFILTVIPVAAAWIVVRLKVKQALNSESDSN
ncbi:ABC-2 type transport system permease protein [Cyclonatronum proteinivorum]|uniref:ABC-2 type transport system permease protein n=1 Tax=Cyclonatronum proteinivorum TaxID=1457365 RepID=A0A345UL35_9BACT|nr:ABC transporter permease [Cyclonatronum proteinivorum]AXJ01187.1 ABC-2 type transport system permease protein [Cyclonatronum proteinivorum]